MARLLLTHDSEDRRCCSPRQPAPPSTSGGLDATAHHQASGQEGRSAIDSLARRRSGSGSREDTSQRARHATEGNWNHQRAARSGSVGTETIWLKDCKSCRWMSCKAAMTTRSFNIEVPS
jgi:hypothetical protein